MPSDRIDPGNEAITVWMLFPWRVRIFMLWTAASSDKRNMNGDVLSGVTMEATIFSISGRNQWLADIICAIWIFVSLT